MANASRLSCCDLNVMRLWSASGSKPSGHSGGLAPVVRRMTAMSRRCCFEFDDDFPTRAGQKVRQCDPKKPMPLKAHAVALFDKARLAATCRECFLPPQRPVNKDWPT